MSRASNLLSQLYILGDLFDFWVGDDGSAALGQEQVEHIIRRTTNNGLHVFFIHGNRDFLIGGEFEKRTGCKILADQTLITLGSESVLLTHGDSLCSDDIEHQIARKTMVTSKWKNAFLNQSIEERINTASTMRKKSEISKKSKSMEIMDVNQQHVESVMREHGVLTMIHGHTHKPAIHEFTLDAVLAKRYVLGDWYTQKSVLYYDNGNFALQR